MCLYAFYHDNYVQKFLYRADIYVVHESDNQKTVKIKMQNNVTHSLLLLLQFRHTYVHPETLSNNVINAIFLSDVIVLHHFCEHRLPQHRSAIYSLLSIIGAHYRHP